MQSTREPSRSGLASANCGECRRRKQKCNREWPCNRCHARKVPHLCHFGGSTTSSTRHARSAKARRLRCNKIPAEAGDNGQHGLEVLEDQHVEAAVRALGSDSQPGHRRWAAVVIEQPPTSTETALTDLQSALDLLYSSEFTGLLIQHFLYRGNYYHYILYDAQFTEEYAQWWQDRRSGQSVSVAFTCLVLRICACAAQYFPAGTRAREDMQDAFRRPSQSSHDLALSLHGHAQQLGSSVAPGTGGLAQVQQLMLGVVWLQHASQWTAAWHALAAAIHEAQEQDMHLDSDDANVTDFEKDMRRQAWCLLCAWDWQSSILLGRPSIINQDTYAARVPVLKLHSLASGSGHDGKTPTPSTHMLLQYELASRVAKRFGTVTLPLPIGTAMGIVAEVRLWLEALPDAYRMDTSQESENKNTNENTNENESANQNNWLVPQMAHLHSLAYTVVLTVLKPFVAGTSGTEDADANTVADADIRNAARQGISAAITVTDINYTLYKRLYPGCSQPNAVFSAVVSVSAFLCQALSSRAGSEDHTLPRRHDIIASVSKALEMLYGISSESQTRQAVAQTAFAALHRLALQLPLRAEERALLRSTHHRERQGQQDDQEQHGSAVRGTKRSALVVPEASQLWTLYYPAGNTNTNADADADASGSTNTDANSLMARPLGFCNAGDYAGQAYSHSAHPAPAHPAHPSHSTYSYSFHMPLPAFASRNGGGLALHGDPPPLSQTAQMAGLHGLEDSQEFEGSLNLGGVAAWPMDLTAGPPFLEQPDDGQGAVMAWRG